MINKIKKILKNITIMIVEDDDELRDVLFCSIKDYVNEILTFSSPKDALKCFNNEVNLIISDINMPYMDGLQMAKIIRQIDKNVPIIFLTAFDSDENLEKAIDIGSYAVLKKPFEKRDLLISMSLAVNKFEDNLTQIDLKNGFKFNSFSKELSKYGKNVALTKKEQNLLNLLIKHNGELVNFKQIENFVWQNNSCTTEDIRSFVYKLRKKLYPDLIQNCQGLGYKLNLSN